MGGRPLGLDLIVEARAKAGHEAEWRGLVERYFADEPLDDEEKARFDDISVPAYASVGAPRVGFDPAADAWIIEVRGAETPEAVAEVLRDFHGHYALPLVRSPGLPKWTHANLYEGVDETSFRGKALEFATDILTRDLIDQAFEDRMPEDAVAYGQALLEAAERGRRDGPLPKPPPKKRNPLAFLIPRGPDPEPMTLEEQLDVVEEAGRWFVFWGERGHPIRAWV